MRMRWPFRRLTDPSVDGPISESVWRAPLVPDQRFFVIGDIHGEFDLLVAMFRKLESIDPEATIVCVGDYIDRGPQSAEVLFYLQRMQRRLGSRLICLKGNHEAFLLDFLDSPGETAPAWLRNGGLQTLASFGTLLPQQPDFAQMRDELMQQMGSDLVGWTRELPLLWRTGNVIVSHAGGNPTKPMEAQSERALLWGHRGLANTVRSDDLWMVHGHFIHDDPTIAEGRIAVDTGAYATGRLTAADISHGVAEFHQVTRQN